MTKRRAIRLLASLLVVTLLSALGVNLTTTGHVDLPREALNVPPGQYAVTSVSDGDTFKVRRAGKIETVRMIGIDTPETKDPRKPVQCFGKAASDKTKSLLTGRAVRLEADPADSDRDKYNRLLRYVYLPDGTFVNRYLVENGYAFAYTLFPFTKIEEFRGYERSAREHNAGLWAGCQVHADGDKQQTQDQP